jgi:predicted ABC-type ATPase
LSGRSPQPWLWIVAGPNGCGKSTIYGLDDFAELYGSLWIINPDLLTARLQVQERLPQEAANLAAVKRIEAWLDASIEVHQTIGVETVLSTSKYRRLVEKAQLHGFQVGVIYAWVNSPELQIERIRMRVAKGGHAVPDDKVRARRGRSLEQLGWFFWAADEAWIYDNSSTEPVLMVSKQGETVEVQPSAAQEILGAIGIEVPPEG